MKRAITSRDNKKAFEVYISKLKRFFIKTRSDEHQSAA
ncbi:hypothetical protein D047_3949 [Vibrio parahaemolyticus VPTS-2010_2]|nr:hypothetical protein D029_0731 [Vibrio parahaemolyticus 970107]EXJ42702.1 hypothetical protein D047_3949 [Vibrio parahaemolyticus VPTS-2010_2]